MRLSQKKIDKIKEQILSHLYHTFPTQQFTAHIAQEIARDEEFIKRLLLELKQKNLVTSIKKNSKGIDFTRRIKWQLSPQAYNAYNEKANSS
tara:strand:- start:323 stop:598 length:276 start_codon:yes stop_codon:yes gene_type:complete